MNMFSFFLSALKKGRSEARPRADVRTRPRVRELFSVESFLLFAIGKFAHNLPMGDHILQERAAHLGITDFGGPLL
jgi:hypothetical protein